MYFFFYKLRNAINAKKEKEKREKIDFLNIHLTYIKCSPSIIFQHFTISPSY